MKLHSIFAFVIMAMASTSSLNNKMAHDKDVGSLYMSESSIENLIVYYEVGGKNYYIKNYQTPQVPAWRTTSSGVTVGIGVDVGHMSKSSVQKTFDGIIPQTQIDALKQAAGYKGSKAYYTALPKVKYKVKIGWDDAYKILTDRTLPTYSHRTAQAFKIEKDQLHGDLNGALVSLVYNRGSSMSGSRRSEMRQIRDDIAKKEYGNIGNYIRSMKRLWSYSKLKGLHLRRDKEAEYADRGAKEMK